jgi:luciferase family oxidoreductase group 1
MWRYYSEAPSRQVVFLKIGRTCVFCWRGCDFFARLFFMIDFSLNALDQSAITTASDASQAVHETVELACYLDGLGFRRFWLAEHHNTAAFAGAAPEVLIAHIASRTSRISVGSGGIMLPHYAPLKVAEQFRMLETLAPGRIDLGIGRAPGGDPRTTAALQSGPKAYPVEVFPQQVEILLQFLEDAMGLSGDQGGFAPDHPYQGIHAQPRGAGRVPVWMLGSGGDGAFHAARFGLPYVYAHFINPDNLEDAAEVYRKNFRPSGFLDKPKIVLATSVLAAASDEEAQYYARPRNIWAARLMQNLAGEFPSLEEAQNWQMNDYDEAYFGMISKRGFTGTPDVVMQQLDDLVRQYELDEVFMLTLIPDLAARKNSYKLLAEQAGLVAPARAAE